jgi:hypothetical protein
MPQQPERTNGGWKATGSWSHTVGVQGGKPFDQKGFWSAIIVRGPVPERQKIGNDNFFKVEALHPTMFDIRRQQGPVDRIRNARIELLRS